MDINEEHFSGFAVVCCTKCGKNKVYYNEEDDEFYCPICHRKAKVLKKINKEIEGKNIYSVNTEKSFFNY